MLMIETTGLGKTFEAPWVLRAGGRRAIRRVRALQDVAFQVEAGEVFGCVGPNGAGKTTLLKVLATLLLPTEGRARLAGADLLREPGAVRRAIGLATGEERAFYWRLSGRENLEFFAGLLGLAPRVASRRAEGALARVGLQDNADEAVARYSTGMRQRLGLARALLGDPPVLFLDEPTRSLDPLAAEQVRALIRGLADDHGKTVLLATHHLDEAVAICDRVAVLVRGRIREILCPNALGAAGFAARYRALVTDAPPVPVVGLP